MVCLFFSRLFLPTISLIFFKSFQKQAPGKSFTEISMSEGPCVKHSDTNILRPWRRNTAAQHEPTPCQRDVKNGIFLAFS
jgi:hypothetical protein